MQVLGILVEVRVGAAGGIFEGVVGGVAGAGDEDPLESFEEGVEEDDGPIFLTIIWARVPTVEVRVSSVLL